MWKLQLDKLGDYEIQCQEEVEKMENELICWDRNVTFADLLTKNVRKVAVYLILDDVKERLYKIKFGKEFPVYSSILKFRVYGIKCRIKRVKIFYNFNFSLID